MKALQRPGMILKTETKNENRHCVNPKAATKTKPLRPTV